MTLNQIILISFNGITTAVSVSCLLICLFAVMVHRGKEAFRQGLFGVVFSLVCSELSFNVLICLKSTLHLLSFSIGSLKTIIINKTFEIIIISLFTFILNIIIFYHIGIIYFLQHYTTEQYPDDNKDINNNTIKLLPHSFNYIHYLSFIGSFIITLLYLVILYYNYQYIWNLFDLQQIPVDETKGYKLLWLIVFVLIIVYCLYSLISSGLYCCSSICNKYNVFTKIYLKSFAFYTLCYSINWIAFQIGWLLNQCLKDQKVSLIIYIVFQCLTLMLLIGSTVYRWKCYYIQTLFGKDATCLQRLQTFLNITFCRVKPKGAMIIDYNSLFVMHSLATYADLIDKEDSNSELDSHVSQSLILEN